MRIMNCIRLGSVLPAKYWDLPGGERGYDPMIDPTHIKNLQLKEGSIKDALIVSFLTGDGHEPSDVDISFGKVEVERNQTYKKFANCCMSGDQTDILKASRYIKHHLQYVAYGDHIGTHPVWRDDESVVTDLSERAWKTGSQINEAFMVAANHLVGKTLAAEGWPAIYRVHDPEDEQYLELLSASAARYSRTPGPHTGLRLDPYCRVTSPLRRLDDFVMNRQLSQRYLGKEPTAQDVRDVAFAVRRLNQELITAAPKDVARLSRRDILGKSGVVGRALTAVSTAGQEAVSA
jgi:hypothetical protein